MRVLLLTALFVSFNGSIIPQYLPGAKQISLSHSDVALSNDVFSLFNNPAGLSQITWREIGIYYSPAPFGLSELSNGFIAYNEPFDFGSIAIGAMTYGFELYRENMITAGYSYNYINKFFAGAAVCFRTVSIKNYGTDNAFYLNLGGLYYVTKDFRLGFSAHNVNRSTFGNDKDNIPFVFNSGFSYDILKDLTFNFAFEKDVRYNFSIRSGIEFNLFEYISLRTGFMDEPSQYSAGVGINYSMLSLDYALVFHGDLGLTHQAGLILRFGYNKNKTLTSDE